MYYTTTRNEYSVLHKGKYIKNNRHLGNGSNLPYKSVEMRFFSVGTRLPGLVQSDEKLGLHTPCIHSSFLYCTSGPHKQQKEWRGLKSVTGCLDQSTHTFQGCCCSPKQFPKAVSLFLFLRLLLTLASKHTTVTAAVSACSDELTVSCLDPHILCSPIITCVNHYLLI